MADAPFEIACRDVKKRLDRGDGKLVLIDCREAEEHALVSIDAATLMPMSEFTSRVVELDGVREQEIIVLCHHGMRSAQVVAWLRGRGFARAQSMAGGIDQWAAQIDPTLPRY